MALNLFDIEKHHVGLGEVTEGSFQEVLRAGGGLIGWWKMTSLPGHSVPWSPPGYYEDNLYGERQSHVVLDSSGLGNHLDYWHYLGYLQPPGPDVVFDAGAPNVPGGSSGAYKWPSPAGAACMKDGASFAGMTSPIMSVAFWVKWPAGAVPGGFVIGTHEVNPMIGGFGGNEGWAFTAGFSGGVFPATSFASTPGKMEVWLSPGTLTGIGGFGTVLALEGPMIANDVWYHVAITSDGTTNRLYVNGFVVDTFTAQGNLLTTPWASTLLKFGLMGYKSGFQHLGYMSGNFVLDDVALWTQTVTDFFPREELVFTGPLYGWTLENAYAKFMQRTAVAGGVSDVGGTLDLIAPEPQESIWTQDEFTGGTFQYRYDTDPAMFADCIGYVPSQQSKSLDTVPPVFFKRDFNPAAYGNPAGRVNLTNPSAMFTVAGSIFLCFEHGIVRYITGTDTFVWGNTDIDSNRYYVGAEYDRNEQCIYVLVGRLSAGSKPYLLRIDPETLTPWGSANQRFDNAPVKVQNSPPWGFQINDQNIVVGIGWRLYTVDPPVKPTDATDLPVWTHIGRMPGRWVDSVAYNGMTYILSATADGKTFIVAFDGTYILPIAGMAFNFQGTCMTVYGGRVYIGGSGTDINGVNRYAELHELTGSSTRLVRTFAPESRQSRVTYPTEIWDLTVAEGLLWWAEKNVRLWTYDLTGDAFFGSCVIQHPGVNFYRQVVGRERLWLWGAHDSIPGQHGLYRIPIEGDTVAGYEASLTTSDFVNDFARDKKWHQIVVLTRYYPATQVDYSVDGGATWTAVAGGVASGSGDLHLLTVDLKGIPASKVIRFRVHQPMGTLVDVFGELIAFTVSFTVKKEDNALLKHGWNIIINSAENVEARDGSNQYQDVDLMKGTLWRWAETKAKLAYKDLGGKFYEVKMQDFVEQQPIIGPNVTDGVNPEAYFALTLLEISDDD